METSKRFIVSSKSTYSVLTYSDAIACALEMVKNGAPTQYILEIKVVARKPILPPTIEEYEGS